MSKELDESDYELIFLSKNAIDKNYDDSSHRHTVGAALRCKNGKVYLGVNCDEIHGCCAEYIAMGAAITAGEREFDCIVATLGKKENNYILSPCGNCRQMLWGYSKDIDVIVNGDNGPIKLSIQELLPYPYI